MEDLLNRDNVMAICFVQAFILYSWPRQEKLQQFDRMKEVVRQLIALATAVDSSVTVEATARPAAAAASFIKHVKFFLELIHYSSTEHYKFVERWIISRYGLNYLC